MEEIEEAKQRARNRVAEWLAAPEDLQKVEQLRKTISIKKSAVDAQLKTLVGSQMQSVIEGIEYMNQSSERVGTIRKSFTTMEDLCLNSQSLIKHYELAKQVNNARANILRTRKSLDTTLNIPKKIEELREAMKDDRKLEVVYKDIKELERMKDLAIDKSKENVTELDVLKTVFRGVSPLKDEFQEIIFKHVRDTIQLSKSRPHVLTKVISIIEAETEATTQSQNTQPNTYSSYQNESWRNLVFSELISSIEQTFSQIQSTAKTAEEVVKFLDKTIFRDLEIIQSEVPACFPAHYDITNFYTTQYHTHLLRLFIDFSKRSDTLSTNDILSILTWVTFKYEPYFTKIGILESGTDSHLLEALTPLIESYKQDIYKIMLEWTIRLIDSDFTNDVDETTDKKYYTDSSITLFRFLNQQIDVVQSTRNKKFIFGVIEMCVKILEVFKSRIEKLMDSKWKDLDMTYILACINNYVRMSNDYLPDFEKRLKTVLGEEDYTLHHLEDQFQSLEDAFLESSKRQSSNVISKMMSDAEKGIVLLFKKSEWLEGDCWEQVIATLEDYLENDIEGRLVEVSDFKTICLESMRRVLIRYIEEFLSKSIKLDKEGKVIEKMKSDQEVIKKLYNKHLRDKVVDKYGKVIGDVVDVLEAESETIGMYWEKLIGDHPDAGIPILEGLLAKRGDLDRGKVKEALEIGGELMAGRKAKDGAEGTGVFGKVKIVQKSEGLGTGLINNTLGIFSS